MKKIILSIFLFLFISTTMWQSALYAQSKKKLANEDILLCLESATHHSGMFGVFLTALGALDFYENEGYGGIYFNLNSGFYYDASVGPNWWEYYFEPLGLSGNVLTRQALTLSQVYDFAFGTLLHMPRQRGFELIQKYVVVKENILDEVAQFKRDNFQDSYVIGMHYRGTDKIRLEVNKLSFEYITEAIKKTIQSVPEDKQNNYRLFIATDEQQFLDYIFQKFNCPIIYTNALRSTDDIAIHDRAGYENGYSNYLKGKEALIDCLLLSQCDFLIRTESNLSRAAELFNPTLPVLFLDSGWKVYIPK